MEADNQQYSQAKPRDDSASADRAEEKVDPIAGDSNINPDVPTVEEFLAATRQEKERSYSSRLMAELSSLKPDPEVVQFLHSKVQEAREAEKATMMAWSKSLSEYRELKQGQGQDIDFDTLDHPLENDYLGEDRLGKASPREDMFGIIDLVFRGATRNEAAIMAGQFISRDIFQGSMPSRGDPSSFGRPENEVAVRVIYRRAIHSPDIAYNDRPKKQYESIKAAYKELRLRLSDGRIWKVTDHRYITWFPWNKSAHETTILLDQTPDDVWQD